MNDHGSLILTAYRYLASAAGLVGFLFPTTIRSR